MRWHNLSKDTPLGISKMRTSPRPLVPFTCWFSKCLKVSSDPVAVEVLCRLGRTKLKKLFLWWLPEGLLSYTDPSCSSYQQLLLGWLSVMNRNSLISYIILKFSYRTKQPFIYSPLCRLWGYKIEEVTKTCPAQYTGTGVRGRCVQSSREWDRKKRSFCPCAKCKRNKKQTKKTH